MSDPSVTLYADIIKETAGYDAVSMFGLPAEEQRQRDIQYILAVLVSSGMNLNGAYFLPSELIQARGSAVGKPLDVEHVEGYIVGHIYSEAFLLKDRSVIDPIAFMVDKGTKVDKESIDIATAMALYKYRFPDVAEDVSTGKYKVSMECYYKSFDIKVGDVIISQDEAKRLGIKFDAKESMIGRRVKMVEGQKELSVSFVGRVLRDIMFAGCGLVEYPANPDSVILEAAGLSPLSGTEVEGIVIDMEKSETYMKEKQEREALVVEVKPEPIAEPVEPKVEPAHLGPLGPATDNPATCVSFKKYVYEYQQPTGQSFDQENQPADINPPGAGDSPGPDDKIIHEHWCSLFDDACPVLAGEATHPECLRNVLNRTTKEVISDLSDAHAAHLQFEKAVSDELLEATKKADEALENAAKWDTKYINSLPNMAFAVVESGYKDGDNKGMRHLPHHNANVKSATENSSVDLPHYRNALARCNQINSVSGTPSTAAIRKTAASHLEKHRAVLNKGKADISQEEITLIEECEKLLKEVVEPLLATPDVE